MENQQLPYDYLKLEHKDKLQDRLLDTQLHDLDLAGKKITVITFIEIKSPWHPAREASKLIVSSLVREFVRTNGNSLLARFEAALKHANRIIEQSAEKLETDISVSAVLVIGNEIHFSAIGEAVLALKRQQKIAVLFPGKESSIAFSAITSGDLRDGDLLIIGNTELLEAVRTSLNESANSSIEEVEQVLRESTEILKDEIVGGIILKPSGNPKQKTIFLDSITPEADVPAFKLPRIKLLAPSVDWTATRTTFAKAWNFGRKNLTAAKLFLTKKKTRVEKQPPETVTSSKKSFPLLLKRVIPVVLLLILITVGGALAYRRVKQSTVVPEPPPDLADQVASLTADGTVAFLQSVFDVATFGNLSPERKSAFTESLSKDGILIIDPSTPMSVFPTPVVAIDGIDNFLTAVDSSGQLWTWQNNLLTKVDQVNPISEPVSLSYFAPNNILVSDQAGNIWQFNGTNTSPVALALPASIASGPKLLEAFSGNLYIYNQNTGDFYRVNNFSTDLSPVALYAKEASLALGKVTDIAVEGSVFALSDSGKISSFIKNKKSALAIALNDTQPKQPKIALFSDGRIVVVSGNLIRLYNQTGTLLKTFLLLTDSPVSDLTITGGNIVFVAGKNLFRITLPL